MEKRRKGRTCAIQSAQYRIQYKVRPPHGIDMTDQSESLSYVTCDPERPRRDVV